MLFKRNLAGQFKKMSSHDHQPTDKAYLTDIRVTNVSPSFTVPTKWRRKSAGIDMARNYIRHCHPIYILFACLYCMLPHLAIFLHFSLLIFSFDHTVSFDPYCFQVGCHKRRPTLALVFLCSFSLVVLFFDWRMRAFVVLGLVFFHTKPSDCRLGET